MFSLGASLQYYLYNQSTDMRKSFDSLSGLISNEMRRNPISGEVFIFINKPRNKIKLLHWDKDGFVLYYKRLESGTFELPAIKKGEESIEISWYMLSMIIGGLSVKNIQKRKRFSK
jgi:transposase